ncbi:hypothetical protein KP509_06G000600 [Ceratopteris richardii]|uniref:Uncharacterized protein n=1 Tax=Ceratopteris richardii TaxID=49495 RepID=A0A8T2UF71_CERRI|nr:hypothetical protein KP509_06G000600 [Ceratopteris richardii]
MASFDQKAWDSSHGHRALPFQSKRDMNRSFSSPRLTGIKHSKELMEISFTNSSRVSPSESLFFSNKENVQSWLISTSPTPIFDFTAVERFVGDEAPILSPILSPSISSQISARHTPTELEDPETQRKHAWSGTNNPKESVNHLRMPYRFHDEGEGKLPSTSRRYGKDELLGPPDSPTGSTSSTGSEGRLLAFLAHKLLAYRGNSRRFSRYAREISGPIDEKHVMEDRSKKPAIDETIIETNTQSRSPPQEFGTNTLTAGGGLHRTTSEAVSELSLGSANNRTLSMEFDIMLAAAAAAASGMNQAPASEEQRHHQQQLPRIHEDSSIRFTGSDSSTRFTANEAGHGHDVGNHPSFQDGSPAPSPDADVSSSAMALAVTRQG